MQRYSLLIALVATSFVAAIWPVERTGIELDPFLQSAAFLNWLVALTMFCVGAVLPDDEVRSVVRRWPLVLAGTAVQYISMPLLAWALASALTLGPDLKTGLILVGCVPGAMASNVLTMLARGNVSYSVGLTTSATLLSPIIVPLALRLTLGSGADSALLLNSSKMLAMTVVLPTVLGFTLSRWSSPFARAAERSAKPIANVCIVWIIAVVVALNRSRLPDLSGILFAALVALNLGGYLAGYCGGKLLRLPIGMRRALMLEVGMQNAGVGASLAAGLFPERPAVALPCGLFAFGCMLTGTMLAEWLKGRPIEEERRGDVDSADREFDGVSREGAKAQSVE